MSDEKRIIGELTMAGYEDAISRFGEAVSGEAIKNYIRFNTKRSLISAAVATCCAITGYLVSYVIVTNKIHAENIIDVYKLDF